MVGFDLIYSEALFAALWVDTDLDLGHTVGVDNPRISSLSQDKRLFTTILGEDTETRTNSND